MSDEKTYSEADVKALVAAAVGPLNEKLASLESAQSEAEVAEKLAAAKAEGDIKAAELQSELDAKDLELKAAQDRAVAAEKEATDIKAYLADEVTKAEEVAAAEARTEERVGKIREAANFTDEHIEKNKSRWAAMDEEEFAFLVENLAAKVGPKGAPAKKDTPKPQTALYAARETGTSSALSAMRELREAGVDARRIK